MSNRTPINGIEPRIMIGMFSFIVIIILVGWVAINENSRMVSFERQFQARSIEQGAELFALYCSTCHGEDGRGIELYGPGLNSPHFFGYDYFAELTDPIDEVEEQNTLLNNELAEIFYELSSGESIGGHERELRQIFARVGQALYGEDGVAAQLASLYKRRDRLVSRLGRATERGYPISKDFDVLGNEVIFVTSDRLTQVQWMGTRWDFIFTTLAHGRPTSISYWEGNQMVAWSQDANGPLRDDQIVDLVEYIMNWDKGDNWVMADALAVNQYAIVPGAGGLSGPSLPPAGSDVSFIVEQFAIQGIVGDAVRGQAIYESNQPSGRNSMLGCSGCHLNGEAFPATEGTLERIVTERLIVPEISEYTIEQYIIESIVQPGVYVVPGYEWVLSMPSDYGQRMSVQDVADVVAYLQLSETIP